MNRHCTIIFALLIWLALMGCSNVHSPSKAIWSANPEFNEAINPLFSARIEARKGEYPFYTFFLLTITNRSEQDLIVDWNASGYLFNNKPQGMLVFAGIDPKTVKTKTIPPETIPPGMVFSREIMPMQLIAWSPIKENTSQPSSLTPGMLPAGENGVSISVRHTSGRITIPMSIQIVRDEP